MTPAPLQVGQAPSELALKRAGFTPLALANALRIGSRSPLYVDVDGLQVVGAGAAHLHRPRRLPHRRLQGGAVVQVSSGERAALPQRLDRALEDDLAARGAGAGAEVHDV